MIALARKNLSCLISKQNAFVCKSLVSLQYFSTSGDGIPVRTFTAAYDVLVHKHQFSPQVASLVATDLTRCRSLEKADSTLSFLKDSGFSTSQLEKIVKYKPRLLVVSDIRFKIKIFQELGLSPEDIAKVVSSNPSILNSSSKNSIIPSLSLLKGLLGSNHEVATLITKSAWFLKADLEKTLMPNVEFLKSCGISMERILVLLNHATRCLLSKPDIVRKSVDKAKEMGLTQSSRMFIYHVRMIASMKEETWEVKWQALRNLGFSDSDILMMFRQAPLVFCVSIKKIEKVKELVLATGKYDISSIVGDPVLLMCSIQKRLKPRLQILGILERKNLIEKWPSVGLIRGLTDDKFFERFIRPYLNELAEVSVVGSYIKGN